MQTGETGHISVLASEVMEYMNPHPGGHYIDGTLGGGGHTEALLKLSAPDGQVLGIDTDQAAITRVRQRLATQVENGHLMLVHGNFSELARLVDEAAFSSPEGILLDLGFSSDQMDMAERGFAFSMDGPLDMRLNPEDQEARSAAELVNSLDEQELADIIWRYGEESRSRQIARRIVRERERNPITRTSQLARLAAAGVPFKSGAIHPATKTFQALRIAVNRELERLEAVLPQMLDTLSATEPRPVKSAEGSADSGNVYGRRMVIISFHSLEDRLVKEFMRREARDCICPPHVPVCVCGHKARLRILTPKPITASAQEVSANPRARSAKLRAAEVL